MIETWLRSNRRVILLGSLPVLVTALLGWWLHTVGSSPGVKILAVCLLLFSLGLGILLGMQLLRPRVAYGEGQVLFYLRAGRPIAVPIEVIEAFFLGQGPAYLPGMPEDKQETINLVARLSQKEPQWSHQDVKPALGRWCEGYVSIRGTWCEPLTNEVVRRLNRRLAEVSREWASTRPAGASP